MYERTQEARDRILARDREEREGQARWADTIVGYAIEPTEAAGKTKYAVVFTYANKPPMVSFLTRGG